MKNRIFTLAVLSLTPVLFAAPAEKPADPMQGLAASYRAGDDAGVLKYSADVLEADPGNRDARNYLWTVGRRLKEEEQAGTMTDEERRGLVLLAERRLALRRCETEETLSRLRESYEKSRRRRSPADILAGAEGMGRFLGEQFQEERQQALADGYFRGLVENLTAALKSKTFVARKDQLVAEAWLSYYSGDKAKALKAWESAAAQDPADRRVADDLDSLRRVLQRERDEKLIKEWESQAATYQETGFHREALELWDKILTKTPGDAGVRRNAEECRAAIRKKEKDARLAASTEEGVRLYREGKVIEAAQAWFKVLDQDPSYRPARVWLAHAGNQLGDMEQPASASKPSPAAKPSAQDDKASAVTDADRAAALEFYKQGLIAYSQDRVSEAVDLWEKALARRPDLTQAREALRQARAELSFKKRATP